MIYVGIDVAKDKHDCFITNSDGSNPAKSPMEMFEMRIPNDLKEVDKTIREYWEIGG